MRKTTILFLFIFIIQSCKDKGCEDMLCFTPPPSFAFELIDKITTENLFTNGTLSSNDIKIVDEDNKNVNYEFIIRDNLNIINILEIGWNLGFHTYTISVGDNVTFNLELEMEQKNENCCTFFKTNHFSITNYTYTKSNTTDVYQVQID